MGRTRILKPSFFRSASLAQVGPWARLLFQGLWVEADDEGRGDANPRLLATSLFPFDAHSDADVAGWLAELEHSGHIILYPYRGKLLFAVCSFAEHQSAAYRRGGSKFPPPPVTESDKAESLHDLARSCTTSRAEVCLNRTELNRKEGKGTNVPGLSELSTDAAELGVVVGEPIARNERHEAVAHAFGVLTTRQALARGTKVGAFNAYAAKVAAAKLDDPELRRVTDLFPTAPADVLAAALMGDKHSLQHYPRSDEVTQA